MLLRAALLAAGAGATAGDALPWLRVRPVDLAANPGSVRRHVIADEWGREVALHGACVESEERNFPGLWTQRSVDPVDYAGGACPVNRNSYAEPPICGVDAGKGKYNQPTSPASGNDFAQVRALGFNIVRLCLSWSELEPVPGVYNATYLDRVAQVVAWAGEQGVYVILDLHEDLYSMYIVPAANETTGYPPYLVPSGGAGNDGAPGWAVVRDPAWPSWAVLGIGNLNLAMMRAYQAFWDNEVVPGIPQGAAPGRGLQDHFIGAVAALAARFANVSTVAGYEPANEPEPGTVLDPWTQARDRLYPFYRRVVQAVTGVRDGLPTCNVTADGIVLTRGGAGDEGLAALAAERDGTSVGAAGGFDPCAYPDLGVHDTRHLFFLEPGAIRNLLDFSPQDSVPVSAYPNVVHTPHTYTHVFTIDRILLPYGINVSWYPPSFEFAYATAWEEANNMSAAVFTTEFGTGTNDDPNTLVHTLDAQDTYMTGATLWSWKSNCDSSTPDGCDWAWTVYFPVGGNGTTDPIPPNGDLDPERAWLLSRTGVRGAVGELTAYAFNRTTRSFVATFNVSAAAWEALAAARGDGRANDGGAPRHLTVSAAGYSPDLPTTLAANGTVTEVYVPPSIPFPVTVTGAAAVNATVTWPDGSRSVYVTPTGPGVYGVAVLNGSTTGAAALTSSLAASAVARRARALRAADDEAAALTAVRAALPRPCRASLIAADAAEATAARLAPLGPLAVLPLAAQRHVGGCVADAYADWLAVTIDTAAAAGGLPHRVRGGRLVIPPAAGSGGAAGSSGSS